MADCENKEKCREVVSANLSKIPKPEVARQWEHLRCMAEKIVPYNPEAETSLLIGNNCPRIIRPREVVLGGEDEPYGQRTLLGWGVIGSVCKSAREVIDQKHKESVTELWL